MDTLKDTMYQPIRARLAALDCYQSGVELDKATARPGEERAKHLLRIAAIDAITQDAFAKGLIRSPGDDSRSGEWALKRMSA